MPGEEDDTGVKFCKSGWDDPLTVRVFIAAHNLAGKCQVYNRGKTVWSDPEDHIHICESCYHRHAGASGAVVS